MSTDLDIALNSGNSEGLISIINANPTFDTVTQLTEVFVKLSQQHPDRTDLYASSILSARDSGKISSINLGDADAPLEESFSAVLNRSLYNIVTAKLYEESTTIIEPGNSYIIASLISGTVIRTGLSFSSAQIGEITSGLRFKRTEYWKRWKEERWEINAVGACVHLVAAGKLIYWGELVQEAELKKRLGLEEIRKSIKDPAGERILKAAQSQVENDFKDPLTCADIWKILFG